MDVNTPSANFVRGVPPPTYSKNSPKPHVLIISEKIRALQHFDSSLIQGTLGDYVAMAVPVHDIHRLEKLDDSIDVEQVKAQEIMDDLLHPKMIYE